MKDANREVLDRGSLPELLADRARRASDRRLALDAALGLTVAAAIAVLRPPLWLPLAALGFCLGAFGLWGILDRELVEATVGSRQARAITFARAVVAIVGVTFAVLFAVSFFFGLLGRWIS